MKLTGQKLKEKREASRLTISEVSLATKINPKVLGAMENGEMESLPATIFLRGFVRSYAGFLKMNVTEILAVFSQELEESAVKEAPLVPPPPVAPEKKVDVNGEGSGTFRMFLVGGILILIALIIGVRALIQKYERERTVETSTELTAGKADNPNEAKPATDVTATPAALATPPDVAMPSPSASASAATGPIESSPLAAPKTDAKPGLPVPAIVSKSPEAKPVSETKPETKPPPELKVEAKPTPKAEAKAETKPADDKPASDVKPGKKHEIILEALDKVEVKFQLHGVQKKLSMAPSEVHTIIADEPVTLDVSDGGALNITDNGRDKGPAGDLGHPKKVSVP